MAMKKSTMFKILGFGVFIIMLSVTFVACSGDRMYNLVRHKLAEVRQTLFYAIDEHMEVTFISGMRESEYAADGIATELVPFGIVTFKLIGAQTGAGQARFEMLIGNDRFDGELELNPFDSTYMADIGTLVQGNAGPIVVRFLRGTFTDELVMQSVSNGWKINHTEALRIAVRELRNELENFVTNGEFSGEGYVKIITDPANDFAVFYWYVSFVNRSGQTLAVIVDPMLGEVLARKTV